MKPKRYGNTLPVRLNERVDAKLKLIADRHGLSKSDVLRMAINHGLPKIEAGQLPVRVA